MGSRSIADRSATRQSVNLEIEPLVFPAEGAFSLAKVLVLSTGLLETPTVAAWHNRLIEQQHAVEQRPRCSSGLEHMEPRLASTRAK